ncbi:MAG: hypothetical protein JXQ75_15385 [Phycisphaerae bacterium]|nr:hypothetical protein [Phycisphaerae bacterium]
MTSLSDPRLPPRRRRIGLGVLVVAWGLQAIVMQSLLVREALVLMFGSEFAWGIVLFAWLLGIAVGAAAGGWAAGRLRRADVALVAVLMALSVAACAELWVFRGARAWLGIGPGELLPLAKTALAAMLFISPASALLGMAFPLACRIAGGGDEAKRRTQDRGTGASPQPQSPDRRCQKDAGRCHDGTATHPETAGPIGVGPIADIYALESIGSLVGGAAFSFWAVEHLAPIETAMLCVAITAAASAGFLAATARGRFGPILLTVVAVASLVLTVLAGRELNRRLVLRRWRNVAPGYELCAEAESKYQNLAVGRRLDQFTLYCDGHVTADFPDPYTYVPLAHFWMCEHPAPRHVLVLGGGAEGLLAEILRHPIEHVDYVEPDPRQIGLIEPYLPEADRRAIHDQRVTVHHVDARYFVKTQRSRFDLVIARLPEPTSALRARFYTDGFYGELRRAMTGRSVLCTTVAAAPADLPRATADYVASIRATLERHFPYVTVGWGDTAQVLAATASGLVSTDPAELARRYAHLGIQSPFFHPLMFEATDQLDPEKLQARAEQLDAAANVEISTDMRPVVYVQRLALWEQMTSGQAGRVIGQLRSVSWPMLTTALAVIAAVTLIACRLRSRSQTGLKSADLNPWASGVIVLSVGTTGFATMALSVVWLFAFQNLYGYVYSRIGWIIALFMAGLVIGCWLISRRSKRFDDAANGKDATCDVRRAGHETLWRRLIAVDVLIALLALAVPFVLPVLGDLQDSRSAFVLVEWAVSIMVGLTGILCGAAFALAGGLQLALTGRVDTAAGSVVGADHAGACLGALLTGILLVPVFGTAAAAYLLVGIKVCSAVLLLLVWKTSHTVREPTLAPKDRRD